MIVQCTWILHSNFLFIIQILVFLQEFFQYQSSTFEKNLTILAMLPDFFSHLQFFIFEILSKWPFAHPNHWCITLSCVHPPPQSIQLSNNIFGWPQCTVNHHTLLMGHALTYRQWGLNKDYEHYLSYAPSRR